MLVFDFDGTIADSLAVSVDIANEIGPHFGLPSIDESQLQQLKGLSLREFLQEANLHWSQVPELAIRARAAFKKHLNRVEPIAGMPELIESLAQQSCPMHILTSNTRSNVQAFLKKHDIQGFGRIISPRNIHGKGASLKKLCTQFGYTPDQALMIGDELRDIQAAQQAAVPVVAVTWGLNSESLLRSTKPTHCVTSVDALHAVIQQHLAQGKIL